MTAPERLYGWMQTQLSTARHFGGCHYQGARYCIDDAAEGWPLVRADVLRAEVKARREAEAQKWRDERARADAVRLAQGGLF